MPIFGSYPYTFSPNTVIVSSQVNANFDAIASAVNANAAHNGANSDITSLSALASFMSVTGSISGTFSIGGVATFSADILMNGTGELKLAAGTTAQRSGSPVVGMIRYNTTTSSFEGYGGVSPAWGPLAGSAGVAQSSGLVIKNNTGTPNSLIDVSVMAVQLVSSGTGTNVTRSAVSVTINTAASGANGLDTGSLAASTWYNVWLIDNGTTTSGLLSLSATSPTLPSGYIYACRCGAVRVDGSSNLLRTLQKGARAQYTPVTSTNTAAYPVMGNSTATIAVANFVPPTATTLRAAISTTSGGGTGVITLGTDSVDFVLGMAFTSGNLLRMYGDLVLESTNVFLTVGSGTPAALAVGWIDSVIAS